MTLSFARRQKERIPTARKAITFSMPPKMAEQFRQVMEDEGRTMRELIREAIRQYMDARAGGGGNRGGLRRNLRGVHRFP